MVEFSMPWWQFVLIVFGGNVVAYLAGVIVGKQTMLQLILGKQQQMPQMPGMPGMPPMPNAR